MIRETAFVLLQYPRGQWLSQKYHTLLLQWTISFNSTLSPHWTNWLPCTAFARMTFLVMATTAMLFLHRLFLHFNGRCCRLFFSYLLHFAVFFFLFLIFYGGVFAFSLFSGQEGRVEGSLGRQLFRVEELADHQRKCKRPRIRYAFGTIWSPYRTRGRRFLLLLLFVVFDVVVCFGFGLAVLLSATLPLVLYCFIPTHTPFSRHSM